MAQVSRAAVEKLLSLLKPAIIDGQIQSQNVAADLAERAVETKYPSVCVYCEKLANAAREKFRTFSGKAQLAVEVRLSQDRLEGLEGSLLAYIDTVTQVLDQARGDWGSGMYFGGAYEVAFSPVKHGGRNFLQTAKVTLQVEVSQG